MTTMGHRRGCTWWKREIALEPGLNKMCLYTEYFVFCEVPHNLKNEAKKVI